MANTIMHFEIPADDVKRAKTFYEKTFGWKITQLPMPPGQEYWGVTTRKGNEPGINGGMLKRNMPDHPLTNYITVKSIDPMIAAVQANGATVVMPKQEIPGGMGWIAVFKDPENNIMGLHQPGPPPAARRRVVKRPSRKPAKKSRRSR